MFATGSPCVPGHSGRSCSSPKAEVAAVHEANRARWQISTDQPQHLVIGLFIRDVAGVPSSHSWLPPTSSTRSGGATTAIKSMARPCSAASAGCSRQISSAPWNAPWPGQRGHSTCESPKSQFWGCDSGSFALTTSWSLPLCCETLSNTRNGSGPSSRRCSDLRHMLAGAWSRRISEESAGARPRSLLRPQALGDGVPGPARSVSCPPQSLEFRQKLVLRDVGPDGAALQGQCVCGIYGDRRWHRQRPGPGPPGGKVSI